MCSPLNTRRVTTHIRGNYSSHVSYGEYCMEYIFMIILSGYNFICSLDIEFISSLVIERLKFYIVCGLGSEYLSLSKHQFYKNSFSQWVYHLRSQFFLENLFFDFAWSIISHLYLKNRLNRFTINIIKIYITSIIFGGLLPKIWLLHSGVCGLQVNRRWTRQRIHFGQLLCFLITSSFIMVGNCCVFWSYPHLLWWKVKEC